MSPLYQAFVDLAAARDERNAALPMLSAMNTFTYTYHCDVSEPLVCELEYTPAENGGREYPSSDAYVTLGEVRVNGVDILCLLPDSLIERIQEMAFEQYEDRLKEMHDDYQIEREMDRRYG